MPTIVIIGESGQLAQSLRRLQWPRDCVLEFVGRRRVPRGEPASIAAAAAALKPDLLLNAAAFTGVDRAESERSGAAALNAELPAQLAKLAQRLSIPLIHISTDYVFDGEKRAPYLETDAANPLSVYGATKLDGDRNVEEAGLVRWAILRTSWVISEIGQTFPVKLLQKAGSGEALRVVDDQVGCPTPAAALALAMQALGLRLLDRDAAALGLFNYCGAQAMSWHGLAILLVEAAVRAGMRRPALHAVSSDHFPSAARRPRNSVLDCARIARQCGLTPLALDEGIDRLVRAIRTR